MSESQSFFKAVMYSDHAVFTHSSIDELAVVNYVAMNMGLQASESLLLVLLGVSQGWSSCPFLEQCLLQLLPSWGRGCGSSISVGITHHGIPSAEYILLREGGKVFRLSGWSHMEHPDTCSLG